MGNLTKHAERLLREHGGNNIGIFYDVICDNFEISIIIVAFNLSRLRNLFSRNRELAD